MISNNEYYKMICEHYIREEITGFHSDIYYLKLICEHFEYEYQSVKCKGKYLKDWYIALTDETVTGSHTNSYYLRLIAEYLLDTDIRWATENYFLKIIANELVGIRTPTSLVITVPQLVYSDVFDITGELTDNQSNKIVGASIKLKWEVDGTTYESTAETTDSNGQVTFHRSAPTEIETYDFWLEYEGDATYNSSSSSVETRTVGKETSVLTVTSPLNNSNMYYDGGVSVSGTLLSNDGEAMASKTILIKENSTTLTTLTTDSNGAFSGNVTGLDIGSHTLTIEFEATSEYTQSSATRTVTLTKGALTATKSILSYADSESTVLTATFSSSGKTVKLYDSDNTEIGTMTDNNDGTYSYTYSSSGAGDITFYAKTSTFVSETYLIEDCKKYISTQYCGDDHIITRDTYYENMIVEVDFKSNKSSNLMSAFLITNGTRTSVSGIGSDTFARVDLNSGNDKVGCILNNPSSTALTLPFVPNQFYHIKFTKTGATGLKIEVDDTVLFNGTVDARNYSTMIIAQVYYNSGSPINICTKNLKIKTF